MLKIKVYSGGQSGVDRAALAAARDLKIAYGGYVPKGGWAEDRLKPPGILLEYPDLEETPSADVNVRTELNVKMAHATLILTVGDHLKSKGTEYTERMAKKHKKNYTIINLDDENSLSKAQQWLESIDVEILNIAGPRESEASGIQNTATTFLIKLFRSVNEQVHSTRTVMAAEMVLRKRA